MGEDMRLLRLPLLRAEALTASPCGACIHSSRDRQSAPSHGQRDCCVPEPQAKKAFKHWHPAMHANLPHDWTQSLPAQPAFNSGRLSESLHSAIPRYKLPLCSVTVL